MYRFAALLAVLLLASCCLAPASEGDDAGAADGGSCRGDSDCGAGTYCLFPTTGWVTTGCPPVIPPGSCHRDCRGGRCTCEDDANCPETAGCLPDGGCGATEYCDPPSCSGPGCSVVPVSAELCTGVCLCTVCPAPDAGSGGAVCGLGPDAGACGPNQVCCENWGNGHPVDGGPSYVENCNDLGPDGGCPAGALCAFDDGGAVTSCDFGGHP